MNYCLPIRKESWNEVERLINEHNDSTRYFEIWLDYIKDLALEDLASLVEKYPDQLILLFRRDKLKPPKMSTDKRRKLLENAAIWPVAVDLDVSQQNTEAKYFASINNSARFITSYHNYDNTPDDFGGVVNEMLTFKPDIYKLATFCHSADDAARLIALKSTLNQQNKKSIVVGMGKHGTIARLVCDHWGNELIFAPLSKSTSTAPGQLTRRQLEQISNILGDN